jgi:DNA-directed RNA polymerase specialized sigma subunit
MMKYPLLLKELIKHTNEVHTDYNPLTVALDKVEKVIANINEKKREDEKSLKMMEIQNRFENSEKINLVTPTRRYIREAILGEIRDQTKDIRTKENLYMLFNDVVIRAKQKINGKLQCAAMIPAESLRVRDLAIEREESEGKDY